MLLRSVASKVKLTIAYSDEPRLAQYLEDWRLGARRHLGRHLVGFGSVNWKTG